MTRIDPKASVLFVCMGNICRSPTAHAVFRHRLRQAGLEGVVAVDSAGTHDYHVGSAPDRRAREAASGRGYDLSDLRARRVEADDLAAHDYVLAMDAANLAVLESLGRSAGGAAEIGLLLDYADTPGGRDVPDPYYGGANGFEEVLDLVEAASEGLLRHIRARHGI